MSLTCVISKQKCRFSELENLQIPGDKSISHRAVILGSLLDASVSFSNILMSEDCLNTMEIMKALGVSMQVSNQNLSIDGVGLYGLRPTESILDVGNSGTSIRLLTGLLSAQPFSSTLTGDHSIQSRPMKRVMDPLSEMGASIQSETKDDKSVPPLHIAPSKGLSGIDYKMPVASAQVKSCLLLAGLYAKTETVIHEPEYCRDHTERLLGFLGAKIDKTEYQSRLLPNSKLQVPDNRTSFRIPSDISSAAFFLVLSVLTPNTHIIFDGMGVNPTRDGIIQQLNNMGASIYIESLREELGEPVGELRVSSSDLKNTTIPKSLIPNLIDEIPILTIAGIFADGDFEIRNAKELRVKESDRLEQLGKLCEAMGIRYEEFEDGILIPDGQHISDFTYHSAGDHRMAMSAIIAALCAGVEATVEGCDAIATSFPSFFELLNTVGCQFELSQ